MKIFLLCILVLFSVKVFSQTEDYYSISYLDLNKNETDISGISITSIDRNFLSFQKVYAGRDNITPGSTNNFSISLDKVTEFGYQIPTKVWKRILTAGLISAGTGALLGWVAEGFSGWEYSSSPRIQNGALIGGIVGGLVGSAFGGIISIGARDYETIDVSKLSTQIKYNAINSLIKKGIIYNKDK